MPLTEPFTQSLTAALFGHNTATCYVSQFT